MPKSIKIKLERLKGLEAMTDDEITAILRRCRRCGQDAIVAIHPESAEGKRIFASLLADGIDTTEWYFGRCRACGATLSCERGGRRHVH